MDDVFTIEKHFYYFFIVFYKSIIPKCNDIRVVLFQWL